MHLLPGGIFATWLAPVSFGWPVVSFSTENRKMADSAAPRPAANTAPGASSTSDHTHAASWWVYSSVPTVCSAPVAVGDTSYRAGPAATISRDFTHHARQATVDVNGNVVVFVSTSYRLTPPLNPSHALPTLIAGWVTPEPPVPAYGPSTPSARNPTLLLYVCRYPSTPALRMVDM